MQFRKVVLLGLVGSAGAFLGKKKKKSEGADCSHSDMDEPHVTYGLVHMAKTAGTTINGEAASRFEKVCGHKGYSMEAFANNVRMTGDDELMDWAGDLTEQFDSGWVMHHGYYGTQQTQLQDFLNRVQVYENCDYIAAADSWEFWKRVKKNVGRLELHVPCRHPVDHVMSMANHQGLTFNCEAEDLGQEVERVTNWFDRFNVEFKDFDDTRLKCFSFDKLDQYVDYLGTILQDKLMPAEYEFQSTNEERDVENECIWNDQQLMDELTHYMIHNYDYYRFCKDCLETEDDVLEQEFSE